MESDRVIPPAFLLLRLLVLFYFFFFETRSHCVFFAGLEFTDWNYQAGLELIDICLLLSPEC